MTARERGAFEAAGGDAMIEMISAPRRVTTRAQCKPPSHRRYQQRRPILPIGSLVTTPQRAPAMILEPQKIRAWLQATRQAFQRSGTRRGIPQGKGARGPARIPGKVPEDRLVLLVKHQILYHVYCLDLVTGLSIFSLHLVVLLFWLSCLANSTCATLPSHCNKG